MLQVKICQFSLCNYTFIVDTAVDFFIVCENPPLISVTSFKNAVALYCISSQHSTTEYCWTIIGESTPNRKFPSTPVIYVSKGGIYQCVVRHGTHEIKGKVITISVDIGNVSCSTYVCDASYYKFVIPIPGLKPLSQSSRDVSSSRRPLKSGSSCSRRLNSAYSRPLQTLQSGSYHRPESGLSSYGPQSKCSRLINLVLCIISTLIVQVLALLYTPKEKVYLLRWRRKKCTLWEV